MFSFLIFRQQESMWQTAPMGISRQLWNDLSIGDGGGCVLLKNDKGYPAALISWRDLYSHISFSDGPRLLDVATGEARAIGFLGTLNMSWCLYLNSRQPAEDGYSPVF